MGERTTPTSATPSAQPPDENTRAHHDAAEYALLGLLREGPCHGYRLAATFAPDGHLGPILRLKMSQMYAYLHKLERQGWLVPRDESAGAARPRRVFALTADGERAYDRWLAEPVAATRDIRLDFLLKLAFAIERDQAFAADLVARQRAATAGRLDRLRAQAATIRDDPLSLRRLALGHHIHQTEATLAWLDGLASELRG
ncbi:MAG TPA: PadR family transcriptional regulator [Ktedonobacterales bacterium]|nr:PadR family transcriptional regulator [Ktedonobacterales bacterium]